MLLTLSCSANAQQDSLGGIEIPVQIGQAVRDIRVPHHNAEGELSLRLNAARAERTSASEIKFDDVRIEIFDTAKDEAALEVLLRGAVFDRRTNRVVSEQDAVIKGDNIEITGRRLEFHVPTRQSRLTGPVSLVISNTENLQP